METAIIKALKFNGYKIELSTNVSGKPVARLFKFLTVGVNKGTYKLIQGFYFATEQRRENWIKDKMSNIKANVASDELKKSVKKDIRANMVNPFKVGDIYYDSWGYDQTNIDFYEVVELKGKSVMIQEIGAKSVPGSDYHDSCRLTPDSSRKIGEAYLKPITFHVDNQNQPHYHIKSKHGWLSLYTKEDKGVYCSWGR